LRSFQSLGHVVIERTQIVRGYLYAGGKRVSYYVDSFLKLGRTLKTLTGIFRQQDLEQCNDRRPGPGVRDGPL
jgi:hypothetical protein